MCVCVLGFHSVELNESQEMNIETSVLWDITSASMLSDSLIIDLIN